MWPLVQKGFILKRARDCDAERGKIPNLIMTDFYNRGDVVGAVAQLNGVEGQKPSPINPVEFGWYGGHADPRAVYLHAVAKSGARGRGGDRSRIAGLVTTLELLETGHTVILLDRWPPT